MHKDAVLSFDSNEYHILLEKPMAATLSDCIAINKAFRLNSTGKLNAICHVLRYYAPVIKLKQMIDSGIIGDVVNIQHLEPVGYWHFAHSFVRGNWRKESESSNSLLAKCCHDVDLIVYWMGRSKRCTNISSFGSLAHFKEENAPKNATTHCFNCPHESECCYSAKRIYLQGDKFPWTVAYDAEIKNVIKDVEDIKLDLSKEEKLKYLEKCLEHPQTKYGRCVYHSDNDVCDNQIVNFVFDDNSTATLTMIAFTAHTCDRKTRIFGTKGELEWDDSASSTQIIHYNFLDKTRNLIDCLDVYPSIDNDNNHLDEETKSYVRLSGHGGADFWLIHKFVEAILQNDPSIINTDFNESFESHLLVFAAEFSRINKTNVNIRQFYSDNNVEYI
jgi:predicted dehydrogenase